MARVVRRAASASARRAPTRAVHRRARKHKVIMESVTQEKKKLRSVISFEAKAPSGYTFIPAGNPLLTTTCKERCRKEGHQIYAVSTTPHLHTLSQHVHRIGYHFPSTVVAASCSELRLYLTSSGKAVPFHVLGDLEKHPEVDTEVDQSTINMEARDAIKDLFPTIPDQDLFQIIKTAFQKGQRKVGTAVELPLARRAQLAVVAHIRHVYTEYDRLLKATSFHEARSSVEQSTLAKIIEWRGDDENGETVLEDVFREVIVISDDEDSDAEEDGPVTADPRDPSVEVLSSNPRTHEIQTQPVTAVDRSGQDLSPELSEGAPPGFRFVARAPAKKSIDRRGFSRYQAWNRALNRHRAEAHAHEQTRVGDVPPEKKSPRYAKRSAAAAYSIPESSKPREDARPDAGVASRAGPGPVSIDHSVQRLPGISSTDRPIGKSHAGAQERLIPLESQRTFSQHGSSGRPLALTTQKPQNARPLEQNSRPSGQAASIQSAKYPDVDTNRPHRIPVSSNDRANAPVFVSGPNEIHQSSWSQFGSRGDFSVPHLSRPGVSSQDYVLPSIEVPWPVEKRRMEGPLEHLTKRMSLRSVTPVHSQGENYHRGNSGAPASPKDQNCKRRRLAYADVRQDTRPDPWSGRLAGIPTSDDLAPRGQYRRDEHAPEHRLPDSIQLRRDYPPSLEQPSAMGPRRERNPGSFAASQVNLNARPASDRTRAVDPHEHVSMSAHPQSGVPLGMMPAGDRAFRTVDGSYVEPRPNVYADRSPRLDRVRPSMDELRPSNQAFRAGDRPMVHDAPSGGKLYADGFVRHVDIREARPVDYYVQRPRPSATRPAEIPMPPIRARNADVYGTVEFPQPQVSSEQRLPPSSRVAHTVHDHPPGTIPRGHPPRELPTVTREGRPGSGLSTTRRIHDPRAFQMVEQNRPIYVQQVESHPPSYTVPDGQRVVIVD